VNHPGVGINAIEGVLDIRGNCNNGGSTADFHLGLVQLTSVRQLNKTAHGGTADSIWFCASTPDVNFISTPDANSIVHTYTGGTVRIGEVNYGNAWKDFGLQETRGIPDVDGLFRVVCGLEFFPDFLAGSLYGDANPNKYDVQWAISIGYAAAATGSAPLTPSISPQHHIGILVEKNGISPDGYGFRMWGSSGTFNGASAATNAPAAIIKMSGTTQTGIDFAGTHGDATVLTATNTGNPMITMADDQSIKLGSIWIRGHSGALQYSTNGTSWTSVTLP